jgi:hypothetical protein
MRKLEAIIGSNMVSTDFYLLIPLDKIPDLRIRVDPRRKKVLCKSWQKEIHGGDPPP